MPRIAQRYLLLISLWLLTGCAPRPTTTPLSDTQKERAECLDLASQVAQHPPSHARGRAARDRYVTVCLESR
jgi:hypothetical protein